MPNFILIDNMNTTTKQKNKLTKRDLSKFDKEKCTADFDEHKVMNLIKDEKNVNNKYNKFHNEVLSVINTNAPLKTISKREQQIQKKPWITKGMRKSSAMKNKYYKKFLRSHDNFIYQRYKYYRDKLSHLIRSSKRQYYNNYFEKNKQNMKKVWSKINSLLHRKKDNNGVTSIMTKSGLISDTHKIGNEFNAFYTTVATPLVKKLKYTTKKFSDYLTHPMANSFFVSPTDPKEVGDIIKSLDTSKSSDIYNISTKFIKLLEPKISAILCNLFNDSFEKGVVPDNLKYAFVLPLHKGGSKLEVSNYRPVSILPIVSKILEKLMQKRLNKFLQDNNIVYEHQFGFQAKKSTSLAVLDLYSKLVEAVERNEYSCSVFLDFAKAFDTVNHEIL